MAPPASIRPLLLKYLMDHPFEPVHIDTMVEDLGLDRTQIQGGMRSLIDKGLAEIILMGNAWQYRRQTREPEVPLSEFRFEGDPLPGHVVNGEVKAGQLVEIVDSTSIEPGDLMEIVKCLNDGKILLQDDDGTLYVATRLET